MSRLRRIKSWHVIALLVLVIIGQSQTCDAQHHEPTTQQEVAP